MTYIKPFHAQCDCGTETINIDLVVDQDEDGYVSFSTWWDQNQRWSRRLKLAWLALRGKEYYFSEVILDHEDKMRLRDYLVRTLFEDGVTQIRTGAGERTETGKDE